MSNAPALVTKGIGKLNRFFGGPGWNHRVSVYSLSMATCHKCILGQLFGDYETGIIALGNLSGADYGFVGSSQATSDQLTKEWAKRLERMRDPQPGDQVTLTYGADWKKSFFHENVTLTPYAMKSVIVTNPPPDPDPEPGDRVKHTSSGLLGTVLKLKPGGVLNGHVRVLWDGSTTHHSTPIGSLAVLATV